MLKKTDILLIALLLALSFVPLLPVLASDQKAVMAVITIDGQVKKEINLSQHQGREEIIIDNNFGHNTIIVDGNRIYMSDSDCPDKICVHSPALSRQGGVIACLPHHLLIELKGGEDSDVIPLR